MSFSLPTETIELPSKGLTYPEGHPLANGTIEIKYMTAKEEDILTNTNYISDGSVLDKLLESLVVTKFNFDDILVGDKNAVMVAARILGYGAEYKFQYGGKEEIVDLSSLENKPLDESIYSRGENEFDFELPSSGNTITFKLLTHGDERKIDQEIKSLKKISPNASNELTTRLKYALVAINGDRDTKSVREFIDQAFLARDARAFRKYLSEIQPDVDLTFFPSSGSQPTTLPIGINFFWPDL